MRHLFYCDTVGRLGSVGLLLLRLVMGAAFVLHGWPKIQNPLGWMGPQASVPAIFQALAALAEFGGGMALIVGLLTRLASLGIATNMIVALAIVHLPQGDPFVSKTGGGPMSWPPSTSPAPSCCCSWDRDGFRSMPCSSASRLGQSRAPRERRLLPYACATRPPGVIMSADNSWQGAAKWQNPRSQVGNRSGCGSKRASTGGVPVASPSRSRFATDRTKARHSHP